MQHRSDRNNRQLRNEIVPIGQYTADKPSSAMVKKRGPLPTPIRGEKRWTPKQTRFIEALMTCRSVAEAAVKAGYPEKNARQSGHQALKAIRGRVPNLMERLGLSEEHLIDKHLRRHLEKKKTVFVREEKIEKVKEGNRTREIVRHIVKKYVIDDNPIQFRAMVQAFLLHGSYAPRNPKEAAHFGVKVIVEDVRGPARPPVDIKPGMAVPELPILAKKTACNESSVKRPSVASTRKTTHVWKSAGTCW